MFMINNVFRFKIPNSFNNNQITIIIITINICKDPCTKLIKVVYLTTNLDLL